MLGPAMDAHARMHVDEAASWVPITEHDRELVRQQMERLLETTHFRNSRRYPALFRFIVEETLQGRGEFLKERLLGVQVFGRPSDYDTAADPVVRVTVAEIRKRIAQYYHDETHDSELRIELLPGRYEPEFRPGPAVRHANEGPFREPAAHGSVAPLPVEAPGPVPVESLAASVPRRSSAVRWLLGVAALALVVFASSLGWRTLHPSALEQFWAPILSAHLPITLCLPVAGGKFGVAAGSKIVLPGREPVAGPAQSSGVGPESYLALESLGENVVYSDVRALMSLSDLLSQHHAEQRLRLNTAVTLDDLRQGPAVLIGGLDNQWTLRAIRDLRYQFGGDDQEHYWIVDTRTGKALPWSLDVKTPISGVTRDYAIIARVHAQDMGQPEIVVAGIGMSGTAAAGELLSDPRELDALRQSVGPAFASHDFEAVIGTDVVNGIAGSPMVLMVDTR